MSLIQKFNSEPLWLIDGSAFVYRSFYASQSMARSDGLPTGAIFLLGRLLLRMLREEHPKYLAFILDGKGQNFRHQLFPAYKGNRDKTPEALINQLDPIKHMITSLGLHLEISENYEADDYIASLALRYRDKHPIIIVGADKDLRQCLHDQVIMWDPASKNEKLITLPDFMAQTNLRPEQWPDLQALTGDSSDNIPGIPGIGPKTALKILEDYPNLEAIRDNFNLLPDKIKNKFNGQLEHMFMYRELTSLRTDCCPLLNLENFRPKPVQIQALAEFFAEYELSSLHRELTSMIRAGIIESTGEQVKNTNPAPSSQQYSLLSSPPPPQKLELCQNISELPNCSKQKLALRMENDIAHLEIVHQSLAYQGELLPLINYARQAEQIVTPSLKLLYQQNSAWKDVEIDKILDLGLAAYLLSPEEPDMNYPRLLARYEHEIEQGKTPMLKLASYLSQQLETAELTKLLYNLEQPLVPVLRIMEENGVALDTKVLNLFLSDVQGELINLTQKIYALAGEQFNIRSSKQLGEILFERLGLKIASKTRKGQASTDQETLEKLAGKHNIIDAILEYRKLEKMRSTYLEPLPRLMNNDGRIRTTFNQTATATGRLSSSNPNLQNIPIRGELGQRMRSCFTAAPDHMLISVDYSQIELRVLAHLSQEPSLIQAFLDGADIHSRTASLLYNLPSDKISPDQRRNAKTINFGLVYGMGAQSLAASLNISTAEAKEFITTYFQRLNRLKEFYDQIEELAKAQGFVTTITGRRRLLPDIHSENTQVRSQARRQAINTVVQGSAADIIKLAMLAVYNDPLLKELKVNLLLQVHDELLLEAPASLAAQAASQVVKLMENVCPEGKKLSIPLLAEQGLGPNWGQAH